MRTGAGKNAWSCLVLVTAAVLLAGCGPKHLPPPPPVVDQAELVQIYNANCDRIEHLWSRAQIRSRFPKEEKSGDAKRPPKYERHDMDGHLVIQKPDKLFLQGSVLGSPVFNLGSNETCYWLWLKPEDNTVWIGKRGGKAGGPASLALQLPEVLGIYGLRTEGRQRMLFTRYPEHNGIEVIDFDGRRPFVVKRMWFDRREHVPVRIDFFLRDGTCVVSATLADYIETEDGVKIARHYAVKFPADDAFLEIKLKAPDLKKEPKPQLFNPPAGANQRMLDEEAAAGGQPDTK